MKSFPIKNKIAKELSAPGFVGRGGNRGRRRGVVGILNVMNISGSTSPQKVLP